jgi:hypothetical protein
MWKIPKRTIAMKTILSALIALSVIAGITAPANARKGAGADTYTTWHPADSSSSIH